MYWRRYIAFWVVFLLSLLGLKLTHLPFFASKGVESAGALAFIAYFAWQPIYLSTKLTLGQAKYEAPGYYVMFWLGTLLMWTAIIVGLLLPNGFPGF